MCRPEGPETASRRARQVLAKVAPMPLTPGGVVTRIRGSFFPGGVPKRPTGADCKSAGLRLRRFESFPLHHLRGIAGSGQAGVIGGCSSMVEPQPSKLMAWVRFPSPAPVKAHVAQLVEHVLGKDE